MTRRVVVKVGGDVLLESARLESLAANVRALIDRGDEVMLLHGGGPQATRLQERLGMTVNKVGGRRITSAEDLRVIQQAICGEVNVELTCALLAAGVDAFGCHGASGRIIGAVKRPPRVVSGAGPDPIDFGEVGDPAEIRAPLIEALFGLRLVPVVATLGVSEAGRPFNINADTTSVQVARALRADWLLLTTAVGGVYRDVDDPGTRIARLSPDEARRLIAEEVIAGGMIPKVEEALKVLDEGVGAIAIVGAEPADAFALATAGAGEVGTVIAR